jgi:hypothetical protein
MIWTIEKRRVFTLVGAVLFILVAIVSMAILMRGSVSQDHYNETKYVAYTTAYTYFDNTPPGSADISYPSSAYPTLHEKAGGTGTWQDPITLAVGHVITTGTSTVDTPDFAPGTRFYLPNVRRYFIVEDTCGDGPTPQDMPCHKLTPDVASTSAQIWVDLWIDGAGGTKEAVNDCASALTDGMGQTHLLIENPRPDYAVSTGTLFANGACSQQFGDTTLKSELY